VRPVVGLMATLIALTEDPGASVGVLGTGAWLWILVSTALVARNQRSRNGSTERFRTVVSFGDVTVTLAVIAMTGATDSPLRWLLLLGPPLLAYARLARIWPMVVYGAAGFVAIAVVDVLAGGHDEIVHALQVLGLYAGAVFIGSNTSAQLRREDRLRWHVADAGAEHDQELLRRERQSQEDVAVRLHDGPLQLVLSAAQDLEEHLEGEDIDLHQTSAMLHASVTEMRDLSANMYEAVLRDSGLLSALTRVAETTTRNGGPEIRVAVGARTAGPHDGLVVTVVNELLTNVRKHAQAREAAVVVTREGEWVEVTVSDDGRGMSPAQAERAAREGHIGLLSIGRRAAAAGGTFVLLEVRTGTAFRLLVPATGAAAA
jgi:two-component system NarL family sensor kinase